MLLVTCPYCGDRPEIEFNCGGEAHIVKPTLTSPVSDDAWAEYLFYRANPKGLHSERWIHSHGCGRWFNALRNTASDRFEATYRIGEPRPNIPEGTGR